MIELRNVSRQFGATSNGTTALKSVNLTVERGEFVAIVGPSGSGKSTLLNLLGLLDRPSSGTYLLNGTDVSCLSEGDRNQVRNQQIGFVFQSSHMLLDDTASGNAALPLKVRGVPLPERRALVGAALIQLGVGGPAGEYGV